MDLKSIPALNSTRERHVQAVAVPAAAAVDGLNVGGNRKATPAGVAFFNGGRAHGIRSSEFSPAAGPKNVRSDRKKAMVIGISLIFGICVL